MMKTLDSEVLVSDGGRMPGRVRVCLPYTGSALSVNHCYVNIGHGRKRYKREVEAWMQLACLEIKSALNEAHWKPSMADTPLRVKVTGHWKDARSACDGSNLAKVVLDTLQRTLGINDKYMLWEDGEASFGNNPAWLEITLEAAK